MRLNQAIARTLKQIGADTVFGLIGDANLFIVDAFVRNGGRYVSAAHEGGAVLMALGHAQVTDRVGVATVSCGPAMTNTLSSLVEGVRAHIPMVLITGDPPSSDKFHLQRISHRDIATTADAGYVEPTRIEDVTRDLVYAFQRAYAEQRPVVFNYSPYDLQWHEVPDFDAPRLFLGHRHSEARDSPELDEAIGVVATAKRPIVLAGYGAVKSGEAEQILRLAERLDAPVMTTLRAKDMFRGSRLNLGIFGITSRSEAMDALAISDCVIAFGAGLNVFTSGHGSFFKGKRVVSVTDDMFSIGRHMTTDVAVLGGLGAVADRILHWLDEAEIEPSGFADEPQVRQAIASIARPEFNVAGRAADEPVTLREALIAINANLDAQRLVVTDGGRFMRQPWKWLDVAEPRHFISGVKFGAIGMGTGYAVGAAVARPDWPTLLVVGDGGFMLGGLGEFNTAVRHGLDLIVVLCNDGGYGAEYVQFADRDMDPGLALFEWPSFAEYARAMGGQGFTLEKRADLPAALQFMRDRDRGKPCLIDLKLDPEKMPPTY